LDNEDDDNDDTLAMSIDRRRLLLEVLQIQLLGPR
jgi:hypothetical protein